MRRAATCAKVILFGILSQSLALNSLAQDFQTLWPSDPIFLQCVKSGAKAAVAAETKRNHDAYIKAEFADVTGDKLMKTCNGRQSQQFRDRIYAETFVQEQVNIWDEKVLDEEQEKKRKQEEADAPILKSDIDNATNHYTNCLISHARILSLNSAESAETIVKAVFPSYNDARSAIFAVYKKHQNFSDADNLASLEREIVPTLILEVIKTRAQPVPAHENEPKTPESPI